VSVAAPPEPVPAQADRLETILGQARRDRQRLDGGAFGPWSLTALGIASVVGAGIFVSTGVAASKYAGPAVILSFLLAGLVAAVTALCYAELAGMMPIAGSTYSYAFVAFGLFPAWFIGWDLLIEYLFAASTVAVGWAGYAVSLLDSIGIHLPNAIANPPFGDHAGAVNLPAAFVVLACTLLLIRGTRESALANTIIVGLKLGVLVLVVAVGVFYVQSKNLTPFIPRNEGGFGEFGVSGILRGASVLFFAYVGFDAVSTAAGEARDPRRTIPIALMGTVVVATVLYVAVGFVLTGMVPYGLLNEADPISKALREAGPLGWLDDLVNVVAVVGLFATVLVTLYGQIRILMRMSADGLLPERIGRVDPRRQTPVATTVICGLAGAVVAALVPIDVLGDFVSIGTLLAFLMVCTGVLVLRRTHPDAERAVRVRYVGVVAGAGLVSSLGLMAMLPVTTWIRLVVWLLIGLAIFFGYSRRRAFSRPVVEPDAA
jgi:APA family basic amino acid/polyamine antiporter